uniref:Uncharacterized protein n=1 Tax=Anopheles culicifacies TaxID=139723 RepID=A0A182MFG7_9DIPT
MILEILINHHTTNDQHTMKFFTIKNPPGVPHIALKLLRLVGVSETKAEKYRYVPMFVIFIAIIAVPKIVFGYPNFESSIIGLAELFFQSNRFVGVLLLVLYKDTLFALVRQSEYFTKKLLKESSPAAQYLTKVDAHITKITRLYLTALLVPANFYSYSPIISTLWKYYNTHDNDTTGTEHVLHMEENFYGLNIRETLSHYLIFGVIMVPTSFICALVGTAKLVSILSLIKYCTIYFQLVTLKLEELLQKPSFDSYEIKSVLRMHQDALGCADLLATLTAPIMLLQLLLCILSAYIAHAVYECNWENLTPKTQKDLQLTLVRAQRPVGITAGKFCFMNMEQFAEGFNVNFMTLFVLFVFDTTETFAYCYLGEQLSQEVAAFEQTLD